MILLSHFAQVGIGQCPKDIISYTTGGRGCCWQLVCKRSEMLLNFLQSTGQPPKTKNCPDQKVNTTEVEKQIVIPQELFLNMTELSRDLCVLMEIPREYLNPRLLLHFFHIQICKYSVPCILLSNTSSFKSCYQLQVGDFSLT